MGARGMGGVAVKAGGICLLLSAFLFGCADDCPEGTRTQGTCLGSSRYSQGEVTAKVGAPVAFDSVQVRLFRGTVEDGELVKSERYGNGARKLSWSVAFGRYAVMASYWRNGVRLDAYDGGSTEETSTAECRCYDYELDKAELDVSIETWPH